MVALLACTTNNDEILPDKPLLYELFNRKTSKRTKKAALFRNANLDFKEDEFDMEDIEIDRFIKEIATTMKKEDENTKIAEEVNDENQENPDADENQDKKGNKFMAELKKIFIKLKKLK